MQKENETISFEDSGKILRPADMIEIIPSSCWLSASCTLKNISNEEVYSNLKSSNKEILTNFKILRLRWEKKDQRDYWLYAPNEELQFENLIKIINGPDDKVPESHPLYTSPHWRLNISKLNTQTKIRFSASHSISDGKSIFEFLDLFIYYATKEPLPEIYEKNKKKPPLLNFGRKNYFIGNSENKFPDSYKKIKETQLLPKIALPSHNKNDYWEFDYAPIKKFMNKRNVSIQGILNASQIWAAHKYKGDSIKDLEIGVHIPVDARKIKNANDEFKNHLFQNNGSVILPLCQKKNTILEQIIHCQEKMIECLNSTEPFDMICISGDLMDEKSGKINVPKEIGLLDSSKNNIVFASHLGRVADRDNIKFSIFTIVLDNGCYWPNLYAYHNSEKLLFTLCRPFNIEQKYVDDIIGTTKEFYDFIKKDIEN